MINSSVDSIEYFESIDANEHLETVLTWCTAALGFTDVILTFVALRLFYLDLNSNNFIQIGDGENGQPFSFFLLERSSYWYSQLQTETNEQTTNKESSGINARPSARYSTVDTSYQSFVFVGDPNEVRRETLQYKDLQDLLQKHGLVIFSFLFLSLTILPFLQKNKNKNAKESLLPVFLQNDIDLEAFSVMNVGDLDRIKYDFTFGQKLKLLALITRELK